MLLVIAYYAIKTSQLAEATDRMSKETRKSVEEIRKSRNPYVAASLLKRVNKLYLIIKNTGQVAAKDIQLEVDQTLLTHSGNNIGIREYNSLGPDCRIMICLLHRPGYNSHEEDPPEVFDITIRFKSDLTGEEILVEQNIKTPFYGGNINFYEN